MKLLIFLLIATRLLLSPALAEETGLEKSFRDALYAEEVQGDVEGALKSYTEAAAIFDQQRDLAATALYRQGECLRKLARPEEAAAAYQKLLRLYPDREALARMARENLSALGQPAADAPADGGNAPEAPVSEIDRVERLLHESPDLINAKDASNPLAVAAAAGQLLVVQWLLTHGADPDILADGTSALHRAASAGHFAVCQALLDAKADPDLLSREGASALVLALDNSRFAVAGLLLDHHASAGVGDLTIRHPEVPAQGETPGQPEWRESYGVLVLAMLRQAPAALCLRLLEAGADPGAPAVTSKRTYDGFRSPLGLAIQSRNLPLVEALLQKGAKPDMPVYDTLDAPRWALQNASPSTPGATDDPVLAILLKHGADLGRTSTMQIATSKGLTGYFRLAAAAGPADAGLDMAIRQDDAETVKFLVERGASLEAAPDGMGSPMENAIANQHPAIVELLLQLGYPAEKHLVEDVIKAARNASYEPESNPGMAILSLFEARAHEAGVLGEVMSAALSDYLSAPRDWYRDGAAHYFLDHGADLPEGLLALLKNNSFPRKDLTALWQAARIKQNPDLKKGIWISRGPSIVSAESSQDSELPVFEMAVPADGPFGPGTLGELAATAVWLAAADVSRLQLQRLGDNGVISVTTIDLTPALEGGDQAVLSTPLQWGDVLEVPRSDPASSAAREKMLRLYPTVDIRLQVGDHGIVTNADGPGGRVLRIPAAANLERILTAGGVSRFGQDDLRAFLKRGNAAVPGNFPVRGDTVILRPAAAPIADLNETALQRGFTICQSAEGPWFWFDLENGDTFHVLDSTGSSAISLKRLIYSLCMPNVWTGGPVAWPEAKLRSWTGETWREEPLLAAHPGTFASAGMMLVLPPLKPDSTFVLPELPLNDWKLDLSLERLGKPFGRITWDPPIPETSLTNEKWEWRWKPGIPPVMPSAASLLHHARKLSNPQAITGLRSGGKALAIYNKSAAGRWMTPAAGRWMTPSIDTILLSKADPDADSTASTILAHPEKAYFPVNDPFSAE